MNYSLLPKILLLLLVFQLGFAQDFDVVDRKVSSYPTSFGSPEKLASRISEDFRDPSEKARAAYTWIARNVRYDLDEFRSNRGGKVAFSYRTEEEKKRKLQQYNLDLANRTLRSKKGVCRGYTALFDRVATLCGLETVTIPGTSKSHPAHIGKLPVSADHIWNAVRIGGQWQQLDVTWAAGALDSGSGKFEPRFNPGYFFTDPELFFLNHFPDDAQWLPADRTAEEFARLPLFSGQYIASGYRITFPQSGILPAGYIVPFRIENLASGKIFYALSRNGKIIAANTRTNGKVTEFDVPLEKGASGYLTIFVGYDSVATFKIGKS